MMVSIVLPGNELSRIISKFIYLENNGKEFQYPVVPRHLGVIFFVGPGGGELIIKLDNKQFTLAAGEVHCAGIGHLPGWFKITGRLKVIAAIIKPQYISTIFSHSPGDLADRILNVSALETELTALNFDLWKEKGLIARHRIPMIEAFLASRIKGPHLPENITSAIQEIHTQSGQTTVSELSKKTFTSSRNLLRIFYRRIGVSPKQYCSMVRFNAFMKDYMENTGRPIESMAFKHQYFDLSHLNKDAVRYLGFPIHKFMSHYQALNKFIV